MSKLRKAAEEFVRRVEAGEVRSRRSYAAFKEALADDAATMGEVNRGRDALWDSFCPGIRRTSFDDAHFAEGARAVLDAVNFGALRAAAMRLYMAGRWTLPAGATANEAALWEALRDALRLRPGTATNLEANPGSTIVDGVASMPVWGCGHDCRDSDCSGCKVVGYEPIEPMLPLDGATAGLVP